MDRKGGETDAESWSEILMVRATSRPEAVACSSKSWMLHAGPEAGLLQAGREGSGGAVQGVSANSKSRSGCGVLAKPQAG
jgi:hypothetical protein